MSQHTNNATLISRTDLNSELAIFQVKPDEGEVPSFIPGQFAELSVIEPAEDSTEKPKKILRRSYSIASAPSQKEALEFYLVLVPEGKLTPKLWSLKVGDKLWLGPKIKGKFTLDGVAQDKNLVMVSTGTGLAPFLSMFKEFKDQFIWRNLVLVHGVRLAEDLGYREELEHFAREYKNFKYIPMCSREAEDSEWSGLRGRVTELFENQELYKQNTGLSLDPTDTQAFLCGNPAMIDSVQETLEKSGFRKHSKKNPGNIHFERYW